MDAGVIAKNIMKALLVIGALMAGAGGVFFTIYIVAIVLGYLFQVGATLDLPNATQSLLTNVSTTFYAFVGYVNQAVVLVGSLLLIGIILIVFAGIGFGIYYGAKQLKSGGSSGGMNY